VSLQTAPLTRTAAGEVVLAQADFFGDGKVAAWICTDCREEYQSFYGLLRHLARGGDRRVVVDLDEGTIIRVEAAK
jgi:hypothetical protein